MDGNGTYLCKLRCGDAQNVVALGKVSDRR